MATATVGSGRTLSTIYEWKIEKFPSYSSLANGMSINSPIFEIKKLSWYLKMFPNGCDEKSNESVSVFLHMETKKVSIKVKYALSIFDSDKSIPYSQGSACYIFHHTQSRGFRDFMKSCLITKANNVTILCEILTDDVVIDRTLLVNNSVKIKIFNAFKSYLNNVRFSDVKFVIGKETILAHKMILAANSTVFDAMFNHDMRENRERTVIIKDIQYDVFYELLRFVYTGEIRLSNGMATELLKASDKYALLELKKVCEIELCKNFSTNNVIEFLHLADKHDAQYLRKEAIDFIVSHGKEMIDQPEFDSLRNLHAELFKDIFRSFVTQPNKKPKII